MKKGLHPKSYDIDAQCACGHSIRTSSTKSDLKVTNCSACHPFFTGAQKFMDTAGRIEKFQKRYGTK